jgi:hypothetical protein
MTAFNADDVMRLSEAVRFAQQYKMIEHDDDPMDTMKTRANFVFREMQNEAYFAANESFEDVLKKLVLIKKKAQDYIEKLGLSDILELDSEQEREMTKKVASAWLCDDCGSDERNWDLSDAFDLFVS